MTGEEDSLVGSMVRTTTLRCELGCKLPGEQGTYLMKRQGSYGSHRVRLLVKLASLRVRSGPSG